MEVVPLIVRRLVAHAVLPVRGSPGAAGYDLACATACVIPARGKALVHTGIAIACPPGTYGRIAPRSSLAWKHFIDVGAGVIDADYRGEVCVVLFNHGAEEFAVAVGDRIAQLVLERIETPPVVETTGELPDTARGAGGFGSTA